MFGDVNRRTALFAAEREPLDTDVRELGSALRAYNLAEADEMAGSAASRLGSVGDVFGVAAIDIEAPGSTPG